MIGHCYNLNFAWPKYKTKEEILKEQKEYIKFGPFFNKNQALEMLEQNNDIEFYFLTIAEIRERLGFERSMFEEYHEGWLVPIGEEEKIIEEAIKNAVDHRYSILLAHVGD